MLQIFKDILLGLWETSGLYALSWQQLVMMCLAFLFMYFAIVKEWEPLLLLPISFGMFLTNLPAVNAEDMVYHAEFWTPEAM